MSLATRCSACNTVFRVQKDQLKASEGWVRCGRCGTVFSALEGLFDLERESHSGPMPLHSASPAQAPAPAPPVPAHAPARPVAPPPVAHVARVAHVPASPPPTPDDEPSTQALVHDDDSMLDTHASTDAADRAASLASFRALQTQAANEDDDEDEAALSLLEHSGSHTLDESRPVDSGHSALSGPASLSSVPPKLPSFVRESDGELRWRQQRPVVRRLTIAAALALPLLLAAQVALVHRNTLSARWPGSADLLEVVCASLGCSVQAPLSLDALAVESSGLTRVEGTALYRLQLGLRNRAAWPVAMPALDLTLTDSRGDIVSRRVLRTADLAGSAPTQIEAGGEWSVLATLDVGERRVTGYTIDLFYP
jgi:predicted Zn finger-like uncharacterized protein